MNSEFPKHALVFTYQHYKSFENTMGKGEIACNKNFSFSYSVSTGLKKFLPFSSNLKLSSANYLSLEESKICYLGIS